MTTKKKKKKEKQGKERVTKKGIINPMAIMMNKRALSRPEFRNTNANNNHAGDVAQEGGEW